MKKVLLELTEEQCDAVDKIAKSLGKSRVDIFRALCQMMIGMEKNIRITVSDDTKIRAITSSFDLDKIADSDSFGALNIEHYYNESVGAKYTAEGVARMRL